MNNEERKQLAEIAAKMHLNKTQYEAYKMMCDSLDLAIKEPEQTWEEITSELESQEI